MNSTARHRFRFIEHTADLGVFVRAPSLGELMAWAAFAVTDVLLEASGVRRKETVEVALEADSPEQLLVRWLTEVLYLWETRLFVGSEFRCLTPEPASMKAAIEGEHYDASRHIFKTEVKAITWHALRVEETPRGWRAFFIVDL